MITRLQIEERLAALRAGQAQLREQFNATEGGIKDCEYWLSVLGDGDPPPVPQPESSDAPESD
ncbi:MAG: hypothetical protein V2A79_19270 [Planctomycetota bacterium]